MSHDHRYGSITDVLMPVFSGGKDEYAKDLVPPKCLSFDRVLEGECIASRSPLLNLHPEILGLIIQYIPNYDLKNLALVNSDCRQWARSQQFKSVLFNYSLNSTGILGRLFAENLNRRRAESLGRNIGPCIRRLTVATNPGWVQRRHSFSLTSLGELDEETANARRLEATHAFFDVYVSGIMLALVSGSMPNLELLDWEDMIVLSRPLLTAMACSSIQHLKLSRLHVNEEFEIELPDSSKEYHWPLKSLHLELLWDIFGSEPGSLCPMIKSIFRLCAPTLEALKWVEGFAKDQNYSFTSLESELYFPRLRRLTLQYVKFSDHPF